MVCVITVLLVSHLTANTDIIVYYTNDVHSYIANILEDENGMETNGLTYSKVAALKSATDNALLVDAGDHIQGTAYGGMVKGETIIELMNAAGYDAATLGNHEFDYDMEGCLATIEAAEYPYISCNFRHEDNGIPGETVLDSYVIKNIGGRKIAFIGINAVARSHLSVLRHPKQLPHLRLPISKTMPDTISTELTAAAMEVRCMHLFRVQLMPRKTTGLKRSSLWVIWAWTHPRVLGQAEM